MRPRTLTRCRLTRGAAFASSGERVTPSMPARPDNKTPESSLAYVVCGPEAFLKRQAIREITDRVLGEADRALSLSEYDGASGTVELADVLDDLRTLPFLTARRLVVVRDADSFITRHRPELEEYAENPSPTGVLLIECKSLPANTRLYKRVQAVGQVIKCEAMKRGQIPAWLARRCRDAYGATLDSRAAAMLCELVGQDLGLLDGELQKLAVYVGKRGRITTTDIEAAVGQHREEQVWGILSAIAAGDEGRALTLWEEVWQTDRAAPARAIGGIAFTVRRLLNAKRAQESGASMRDLARILMRWDDDSQLRAELDAFTIDRVEDMLCRLLEADVAAKTGLASVRSSIEAFVVEMCRGVRSRRTAGRRATG